MLVTVEEHGRERSPRSRFPGCPPDDGAVLGAGETHIEQPQLVRPALDVRAVLATLVGLRNTVAIPALTTRDVDEALLAVVVDERALVVRHVPREREEHDGVLQALARVQGGDLYGRCVGVNAPHLRTELVGRLGVGDELLETAADRRRRVTRARELGGEQLGDVVEVGERALTRGVLEQVLHDVARRADLVVPREHRAVCEQVRPLRALLLEASDTRRGLGVLRVQRSGVLVQERTHRCSPNVRRIRRALERSEQEPPLLCGVRSEHAARARAHDRNTRSVERPDDALRRGVRRHEHRDVAGRYRSGPLALAEPFVLEEVDHSAHQVTEDRPSRERHHHGVPDEPGDGRTLLRALVQCSFTVGRVAAEQPRVTWHPTDLHGSSTTEHTLAGGVCRTDRTDHDARVAELHTADEAERAGNEVPVAPEVRAEIPFVGDRRGAQVGIDVGAAEAIDGLFRVADGDHRGAPDECGAEHLPLHGVGVLEFVDQHEPVTALQHGARLGTERRVDHSITQLGHEVVVPELVTIGSPRPHTLHRLVDHGEPRVKTLHGVARMDGDARRADGNRHGVRVVQERIHGLGQVLEHLVRRPAPDLRPRERLGGW